ncbi:MAG: hypothetical protein WCK77_22285 [Verrucomicrobiota bacterium]
MPPPTTQELSVADIEPVAQPRALPRARAPRQVQVESVWIRRIGLLGEMGWLIGAMTVQLYVPGYNGYGIVAVMLAIYIGYFSDRLAAVSGTVQILAAALAAACLGGLGSDTVKDVCQPLHMGLMVLAIPGVFVAKYHRREDAVFLAGAVMALLIVGIGQSVKRNNLLELWADGQRLGVNLQALFINLALAYGYLLKGRWKLLVLPLYVALFLLGSRTGFITALAFPLIYLVLDGKSRGSLHRFVLPIGLAVFAVLGLASFLKLGDVAQSAGLPVAFQRMFDETVKEGASGRTDLTLFWFTRLVEHPTWFGNGIDSYGSQFGQNWPHNGYLHIFNGLGVICGVVYFWVVFKILRGLLQHSAPLPSHIAWAGTLMCIMLLRKFGEAQILFEPTHVAGFALCYGTGLALWGVEHMPAARKGRR